MPKKPVSNKKLTRRQLQNERHRLAVQLTKVNDRLIAIGMGEVEKATPAEVAALKAVLNKILPDISAEDIDSAIEEYTPEQAVEKIADFVKTATPEVKEMLREQGIVFLVDAKKAV